MTSIVSQLAPTGALRVGVWTVPYFAHRNRDDPRDGALEGLIPDLGRELARRVGVPAALTGFADPGSLTRAFRAGALDVTFVGITPDRAETMDFGPVVFEIQTTYLVPSSSAMTGIAEVDRPGVRIAVPSPSAQEAHLKKTITQARLVPVPPERPQAALDLLAKGEADAFSHVAPMLAVAQAELPGSRILSGTTYNVPIAIGVAKGRAAAVAEFAQAFVADTKASGFVEQAIARAGVTGLVVAKTA